MSYSRSERLSSQGHQGAQPQRKNTRGQIGCLDVCAFAPNMMICPEELWYMKVTDPQIVEEHMKLEAAEAGSAAKWTASHIA